MATTSAARADDESPLSGTDLDVRADDVVVDYRLRELELSGHVRADSPPFHLSSDALKLRRSSRGLIVEGDGRLAFCPCLGTPISVRFSGATVAPPGDLFLTNPRLEIFHIPVLWLPFFWVRAPTKVGLLPPEIAWRGADGLFLGGGVHVPWKVRDGQIAVDLRAGGYVEGGVAVEATATTPTTTTRVRFDRLEGAVHPGAAGDGSGLLVDARGAMELGQERVGWDFDLLRGARGVQSTSDLDAASRRFDVGIAEASLAEPLVVAAGVRTAAFRGGEILLSDAAGPYVSVGHDAALGNAGVYDATLDASVLDRTGAGALALAHGEVGTLFAARPSVFGVRASLRASGDAAADGITSGGDGAALWRAEMGLPLVRSFDSGDVNDPWRHRLEPVISASGLASAGDGALADIASRSIAYLAQSTILPTAPNGVAFVASSGLRSALGRWARRDGLDLEAHLGSVTDAAGETRGVLRWRAAASGRIVALAAEGAHLVAPGVASSDGHAFIVRGRLGVPSGLGITAYVAGRSGVDPVAARLLTDAPLEPASGLLAAEGYSGGFRVGIPWTSFLATRGGIDMDLSAPELTGAVGTVELRDKCGCFRLRINGAHRLGRDGVDVWATIDLVPR